jgi:hypothetical protein
LILFLPNDKREEGSHKQADVHVDLGPVSSHIEWPPERHHQIDAEEQVEA